MLLAAAAIGAATVPTRASAELSVSIHQPAANATIAGTYLVIAPVLPYAESTGAYLSIDGVRRSPNMGFYYAYFYNLNTRTLSDGPHELRVSAVSTAGVTTSASVVAIVDNTPPLIAISQPASNLVTTGAFNVVASITDASSITSTTLNVDGVDQQQNMFLLWGARVGTIDTSTLSEGTHQLNVTATDALGNVSTSSRTFVVDRTAPIVTIHAPTAGEAISGTKQVVAVASDANWQDKASLAVDGRIVSPKMRIYYANYHFLDTTAYANGPHTLTVTATDKAGNQGSQSVVATFDNDPLALQAPSHTIELEAESATALSAPFAFGTEPDAQNGSYIEVPLSAGSNPTPTGSAGVATYTIDVPQVAWYRIIGRTWAPSAANQTVYVSIDGGPQLRWPVRPSTDWAWDAVQDPGKSADPATFELAAGSHTITLTWGHAGVRIDALAITNDRSFSPVVAERVDSLGQVWTADRVQFDLLTTETHQYVGYYDADRWLVVGMRETGSSAWTFQRTSYQWPGFDSHRYISLGIDKTGVLHVAAGMHADALVYFRATLPHDVSTIERVACMICGDPAADSRMTYPEFYTNPDGELLYKYRTGVPGDADTWMNLYDTQTRTWSRQTPQPWLSHPAGNPMGAYPQNPVRDANGIYHVVWVYRTAAGVSNNRTLSYARSTNLRDWTRSDGTPLTLPITIDNGEVIDATVEGGGLLNGTNYLTIAPNGAPVVSYQRFTSNGTQVWVANLANGAWSTRPVTNIACTPYAIDFGTVQFEKDGNASQDYEGCGLRGRIKLDPTTFAPIGTYPPAPQLTGDLLYGEPPAPDTICGYGGVETRTEYGAGTVADAERWLLRWYSLPTYQHFEQRPDCTTPEPVPLRLYKLD
jgi:hypothetical protein